jgi:hypothetical protein
MYPTYTNVIVPTKTTKNITLLAVPLATCIQNCHTCFKTCFREKPYHTANLKLKSTVPGTARLFTHNTHMQMSCLLQKPTTWLRQIKPIEWTLPYTVQPAFLNAKFRPNPNLGPLYTVQPAYCYSLYIIVILVPGMIFWNTYLPTTLKLKPTVHGTARFFTRITHIQNHISYQNQLRDSG